MGIVLALLKGAARRLLAGFAWLLDEPIRGVLAAFALFAAAHMLVIDPHLRDEADKWQAKAQASAAQAAHWRQAHATLLADLRRQQVQAAVLDQQNAARVEREQAVVIERTAHDYQTRLADSRAALERVRGEYNRIAAASGSDGGPAPVPGDLTARCRAIGAADCDALLAALPDQLSAAEQNTAKLVALQDYVRGLLSIDMNGEPESGQ